MRSISSTDTQLYNVMNHELSIDKNDINIKLENTHQANMIRSANELKHFLRKELKNIFIDIVPILPENVEDTTITYNNEEKLVCYDYGFHTGSGSDWCSSCSRILRENLNSYFKLCIESLEIEDDFIVLEEDFMKTLS